MGPHTITLLADHDEALTLGRAVATNRIADAEKFFRKSHGDTRLSSDLLALATRISGPRMTELLVRHGFSMISEDMLTGFASLDRVRHILPNYHSPLLEMLDVYPDTISNEERCAALEIALDASAVRAADLAYVAILYGDSAVVDLLKGRNELQLTEPYVTLLTGESRFPLVYQHERSEIRTVFKKTKNKELLHRLALFSEAIEDRLLQLDNLNLLSIRRMCSEELFMFCASNTDLIEWDYKKARAVLELVDLQNAEGLDYALRNDWGRYSKEARNMRAAVLNSKAYSAQIRTVILEDMEHRRAHRSTVIQGLQFDEPALVRENREQWETSVQTDGTYRIDGYNGSDRVVTIPDHIDGVPVTTVSAYAFDPDEPELPDQVKQNRRRIVSVEYPGTIAKIGRIRYRSDDHGTALKRVILNEGTTSVDAFAFDDTHISEVRLPSTLEYIGMYAFSGCSSLRVINFPEKLRFVDYRAFAYTDISEVVVPPRLEKLDAGLFASCYSLRHVTFSEGLLQICDQAFEGCYSLENIQLPDSLTSIGSRAFDGCHSLQTVSLGHGLVDIGPCAFDDCAFEDLELPEGVRRIGSAAFHRCDRLRTIKLNEGLEDIGPYAFEWCSSLRQIKLPDSLRHLSEGIFRNCHSLKAVKLPAGLRSIGESAFEGCSRLETIEIPSTVETIGSRAFAECASLQTVILHEGLKTIGEQSFLSCSHLDVLNLPTSLQSMGNLVTLA